MRSSVSICLGGSLLSHRPALIKSMSEPKNRRPTRADVAREAGVSKTTVTYVLSNRLDIAIPQSTRDRVQKVVTQLGYKPHAAAQALASGRTNTVTVAFPIRLVSH